VPSRQPSASRGAPGLVPLGPSLSAGGTLTSVTTIGGTTTWGPSPEAQLSEKQQPTAAPLAALMTAARAEGVARGIAPQ